jgi:hypothetical protein
LLYRLQPKRAGRVRLWIKIDNQNALAQLRQCSAEVYGRGRFANSTFLICDRNDLHSGLRIFSVRCDLSDDVAGRWKRKLNFSNFGFGISALAFKRPSL